MKRTVETAVTAFLAMAASTTSVFAAGGTGLDTGSLQSWINNYLEPLEKVLLWVIPTLTGIYILVKAIQYFQKASEGQQEQPFWVSVKAGVIVGIIAESVTVILKVFAINS